MTESELLAIIGRVAEKAYRRGFQHGHLAATGDFSGDAIPTAEEVAKWRFHDNYRNSVQPPGSCQPGRKDDPVERLLMEGADFGLAEAIREVTR